MRAFPSLDLVCEKSGISRGTITKLIKEIEKKGYFTISKLNTNHGYLNCYQFSDEKKFEPASYDFLDRTDLTKAEKLNILCTQQYVFKHNGYGITSYSYKELAEKTGVNRKLLAKTTKSLVSKGYCTQISLNSKDSETGLSRQETLYHLNELGQAIVFTLQDHEEKIEQHDKEIEDLKKQLELALREIDKLKQKSNTEIIL